MSVILVEGAEKSGKSTFVEHLAKALMDASYNVEVRHWKGRAEPDDRIYMNACAYDTSLPDSEQVVIWDRGYPSEFVYGSLLGQSRRLAKTPWLGEWLYGRAIRANGLQVMLRGPSAATLSSLRTSDDLDVSPLAEKNLYIAYGKRFGWTLLSQISTKTMVDIIFDKFVNRPMPYTIPPMYSGNPTAKVVFVGSWTSRDKFPHGGWLPFGTVTGENYGRILGDEALNFGWVNAHECPPNILRSAKTLVTCGNVAHQWVHNYVLLDKGGDQEIINIPHPAYFGNEGNGRSLAERKSVKQTLDKLTKDN